MKRSRRKKIALKEAEVEISRNLFLALMSKKNIIKFIRALNLRSKVKIEGLLIFLAQKD